MRTDISRFSWLSPSSSSFSLCKKKKKKKKRTIACARTNPGHRSHPAKCDPLPISQASLNAAEESQVGRPRFRASLGVRRRGRGSRLKEEEEGKGSRLKKMQDIHSIAGGRMFGATAATGAVGERRLRPHGGHHHQHGHHQNHQALKCPRCDSLNTKFCYYNNYNLSQPRHFCKSCRRYWTKGGVLRNVPVGGGCRKSKRSSKPKSSRASPEPLAAAAAEEDPARERKSSSHSSSESSSLTATTTAVATEAVSASSSVPHQTSLMSINDYKSMISQSMSANPSDSGYEHPAAEGGLFSDIGSFTSLITSSSDGPLPYAFSAVMTHQQDQDQWHQIAGAGDEMKMQEMGCGGYIEQNALVDLPTSTSQGGRPSGGGGFGTLDWQPSAADHGLFDLPNAVDHAYWSHSNWSTDVDRDQGPPGLYLP